MPHETFEAVFDLPFVQISQSLPDGFQRERVHLESNRFIWIPVPAQVRAARSHLDDGNRGFDVAGYLAGKAEFGPNDVVDRRQCLPAI